MLDHLLPRCSPHARTLAMLAVDSPFPPPYRPYCRGFFAGPYASYSSTHE